MLEKKKIHAYKKKKRESSGNERLNDTYLKYVKLLPLQAAHNGFNVKTNTKWFFFSIIKTLLAIDSYISKNVATPEGAKTYRGTNES